MLHIIQSLAGLRDAKDYVAVHDKLILIQDAVYAANSQHQDYPLLSCLDTCVLEADTTARGIRHLVSPRLEVIDYSGFVFLTEQFPQIMTWE